VARSGDACATGSQRPVAKPGRFLRYPDIRWYRNWWTCHCERVTEEDTRPGKTAGWHTWIPNLLLGVGAGTAAEVSGVAADRAITASVTLAAAAVLSAWRLRTLSPRAPILRYGVGLTLALSLIAAILAAIGPSSLAPYMIFGAVGLTGAAVLIQTEASDRPGMLSGIAYVGVAVTLATWPDMDVKQSDRIILIGLGLTIVGVIVADLVNWGSPEAIVQIGFGFFVVGMGVTLSVGRQLPGIVLVSLGLTIVGVGLTMVGVGVAELVGRQLPGWITQIVVGLAAVCVGVAELVGRQLPVGIAFVGGGVAVVGYGVSAFRRH